jgi:hypothetical protein
MEEVLGDRGYDPRATLARARESAHAIGNEKQETTRLRFLRADSVAQARAVDAKRSVEARDEKMIGVRLTNEARMREAEGVDFSKRRALYRRGVAGRGAAHGALLSEVLSRGYHSCSKEATIDAAGG